MLCLVAGRWSIPTPWACSRGLAGPQDNRFSPASHVGMWTLFWVLVHALTRQTWHSVRDGQKENRTYSSVCVRHTCKNIILLRNPHPLIFRQICYYAIKEIRIGFWLCCLFSLVSLRTPKSVYIHPYTRALCAALTVRKRKLLLFGN